MISLYIYEQYMKVAVAQPDPSLQHTHTHTLSEGRDHTQRAAEAQICRFTPRLSAVDGTNEPEGFGFFTPLKTNTQRNLLYVNATLRWTGLRFF